ncbi:signal peptide peptidase SppA [Oceanivirga miroungae]|uniref:Signal peptide peptidase SppA, 36K type n=1 Tax=Oceanivirga miroungae TaxID=1130046 RepID=A0A6I8MDV6_9FUSO|nr:signal peptide peptidase SppA [Oceanivirga miroungae]VWL85717.1 signal peptide peptidase SppA, 36K type [Oceanivirga miroungae]
MLNLILIPIITIILISILAFIVFVIALSNLKNKKRSKIKQKKAKTILISEMDLTYDSKKSTIKETFSFLKLKNKLKAISKDEKIERIIIDLDNFSFSFTEFEEVEEIFKTLRETKEVISIGSIFTKEMYLTALLTSKIYKLNTKNSYLMINGYNKVLPYYKKLLDKIGINVKILNVGDYKSYGENYKLESMSDNLKESIKNLSDQKLNFFIDKVKEYRGIDIRNDLVEGNLFLKDNFENLIDKSVNKYEFIEKDENLMDILDYEVKLNRKTKKFIKKTKDYIAVITLDGTISENELSFDKVYDKVSRISDDENLKGVILEINSPGGSAYESSLITTMLRKELKGLPIFVSMKDVCASGGYFIASSATKIFANKNTLTGSIGVVSMYPNFSELAKKVGVNFDGVKNGETTEYLDLTQDLSEKTENILLNEIKEIYKEFKLNVMRSRIMTDQRLEKIAGGRVFTGVEAFENGLVDRIGSLEDAVNEMKKYLKLDKVKLIQISEETDFKDDIKNKISNLVIDTKLLNTPLTLYVDML